MSRYILFYTGGFVLLALVCVLLFVYIVNKQMPQPERVKIPQTTETQPAQPPPGAEAETPVAAKVPETAAATNTPDTTAPQAGPHTSPAQKSTLEAFLEEWQSAMDDNDDARIREESLRLMKHPDPEVRGHAVDGFSWIGALGLVPLADMMYDPNREVARKAAEAWLEEMRDMKDGATKAEILGLAASNADRLDAETFSELLSAFDDLPEHLAAKQLLDMLKSCQKPEYISEILEAFDFIIQHDESFEDKAKAIPVIEAWLKDPANIQKPEDKDDDE